MGFQAYRLQSRERAAARNLLRQILDAFRGEGLRTGLYDSLPDWHHPDFSIDRHHPLLNLPPEKIKELNRKRKMPRYAKYMRDQLPELLSGYGKIDIL